MTLTEDQQRSTAPARNRAVECFFTPSSVAIIGASTDSRKWGYMAAEQALRDKARRQVHLVNARGGEILGERCHTAIETLPKNIDLAVVTVPPRAFEATIDQLLERNVKAIVAITAGMGEAGADGRAIEARVVARVQAAGSVLVGPNCMGVFDGHAPFRCMPWAEIKPGPIGFISQSGGLIMDLSLRLADAGLGLSRAISIGNRADVGLVDLLRNFTDNAPTDVIAVYAESFAGGRAIFREVARAATKGKTVVVLSPDSTGAATRAAQSHTASLVSERRVVEAATRDAGGWYARDLREMSEMLQALSSRQRGRGKRAFVLTDTGGPGVLLAGAVERAGLEMPQPSAALKAAILPSLTPLAVVGNPTDLVDNINVEPAVGVLQALVASDEVDAVLMNLHAFVHDTPEIEREMGRKLGQVAGKSGKPVVVSCRSLDIPGVAGLTGERIPVFRDGDAAARMLARLCEPQRQPRVLDDPPVERPAQRLTSADYLAARALLEQSGIDYPKAAAASDLTQAKASATAIGFPVALKANIGRKSDVGGVVLHIENEAMLERAWKSMRARVPGAAFLVEKMADNRDGVELIVSLRRDAQFGPVLLIGAGGVHANAEDDTAVMLAPAPSAALDEALFGLRMSPRLLGARGAPQVNLGGIARTVGILTAVFMAHPEVEVLEINPLLALPTGAAALDARITLMEAA